MLTSPVIPGVLRARPSLLKLAGCRLATDSVLPPIEGVYEYVIGSQGLFVRAEDARIAACIPVASAPCHGPAEVATYARLKLPRIPTSYLASVYQSAVKHLPNEAAYQFIYDEREAVPWRCAMPFQRACPTHVDYADDANAVVDLHSHGTLPAFFSNTDDLDEGGLRFYVVIGDIGAEYPGIQCRIGVYGHHWRVPASWIFDNIGPFVSIDQETL